MAPFATAADVERSWRPLTTEETAVVDAQLEYASEIIRAEVTGVDDRITAGTLSAALVTGVTVEMVKRHLRNPEGVRSVQKAIDDYSTTETRDQALSAGSIYLTDDERRLLTKKGGAAFSVAPKPEPATCEIAERVALNRSTWL